SLAEDFYSKRPPDEQRFYRHAALLTRLDAGLTSALLETEQAGVFLEALANIQLPLLRRVDSGYELHDFFKNFLIEKLLEVEGAEAKAQIHGRIAELHEKRSEWDQAVHHLVEAKNWSS